MRSVYGRPERKAPHIPRSCSRHAVPAFYVGAAIGEGVGYDGEAEGALIGAAAAVVAALACGITAAFRGGTRGLLALFVAFAAVAALAWLALEMIASSA
jgi:hypothetical protein